MLSVGQTEYINGVCYRYNGGALGYYETRLAVTLVSQSAETGNGVSTVNAVLQVRSDPDYTFRTYGFTQNPTIQGTNLTGFVLDTNTSPLHSWINLGARTLTLGHDANGDLTYAFTSSFVLPAVDADDGSGYALKSGIANGSLSFARIELNAVWVKIAGVWTKAIPYVKISGVWTKAIAYAKVAGNWIKTKA